MNIDRIQGRAHATSMFASIQGINDNFFKVSGAETILENLKASLPQHKGEFAAGINDIISAAEAIIHKEIRNGH